VVQCGSSTICRAAADRVSRKRVRGNTRVIRELHAFSSTAREGKGRAASAGAQTGFRDRGGRFLRTARYKSAFRNCSSGEPGRTRQVGGARPPRPNPKIQG